MPNQGERVVAGQHLMQASSDIFLGWDQVDGIDGVQRDFYVRQLRDWKGSVDTDVMIPPAMAIYARLCGWTLARAHARSGDRIAIAAYLGSGKAFDNAIVSFAETYADQNERDYDALQAGGSRRADRRGVRTVTDPTTHGSGEHRGRLGRWLTSDKQSAELIGSRYLIRFEEDTLKHRPLWIRLIIEFLGTFILVTVAAGSGVINHYVGGGPISRTAAVIAPGAVVMAMIYALGPLSGLHINPAVTLAFTGRGVFKVAWVLPYLVVQFAGAVAAACSCRPCTATSIRVATIRSPSRAASGGRWSWRSCSPPFW